jgi:Flp pilus assembly protein TadD
VEPVRRRSPLGLILGLLALVVVALGLWWFLTQQGGTSEGALARGVAHLEGGRREAARGEFSKAARDNPESARPHIFLARMAREERDFQTARRELDAAIRLEPNNPLAHREMGALLFTMGNYDLARSFYIRALRGDPEDRSAMGYLGCSLARLNQPQEAAKWIQRAGQGPWSNCLAAPAPVQAPRG